MSAWRFWAITLAAALGVAATTSLGFWQLGRGQERQALQAAIEARKSQPPLAADALLAGTAWAELQHRPVLLRGRWAAQHTVYLDNRQMAGKPGFYVVTPLQLAGTNRAVLVQRGWVQRNFLERDRLPQVDTPAGEVEVLGRIAPPPAKLYATGPEAGGPIRQNLDLDAFAAETGLKLVSASVMETGPAPPDLLRDWPQVGGRAAAKNFGYAVQWWALAALIAILYAWFQFVAPRRRARA